MDGEEGNAGDLFIAYFMLIFGEGIQESSLAAGVIVAAFFCDGLDGQLTATIFCPHMEQD